LRDPGPQAFGLLTNSRAVYRNPKGFRNIEIVVGYSRVRSPQETIRNIYIYNIYIYSTYDVFDKQEIVDFNPQHRDLTQQKIGG
jgi:hypothetical protein